MVKIEHIGIAVEDGSEASRTLERLLGSRPYKTEFVESERVETTFIDAGGPKLELLASMTADSAVGKYLKRRGEGLHHLAFKVDDIETELERVRDDGFTVLSERPLEGADGKRIFFVHPRDCHGILVEFCEQARSTWQRSSVPMSGGGEVTVYTAGSKEATPVLLIPDGGASSSGADIDRLLPTLERSVYVLAFYDQRKDHAERTAAADEVLSHCGVDGPSVVVGFGPRCDDALDFIQSNRERVRVLVLVDPQHIVTERFKGGQPDIPTLICGLGSESAPVAVEVWRGVSDARISVIPEIEGQFRHLAEHIVAASRWI